MKYRNSVRFAATVFAVGAGSLVYGCGGSGDSGTGPEADATRADAMTFEQLSGSVKSTASGYQAAMMGPSVNSAFCVDAHDRYDAAVRPAISQMLDLSAAMDGYMDHYGGATSADYSCMSATMMDELDYHRSRACSSADLSTNQVEVSRHVAAMTDFNNHLWDRCQEMMGSIDGSKAGFSSMASVCQSWDGRCTGMMHSECCARSGHPMADASGMMENMMGSCVDW